MGGNNSVMAKYHMNSCSSKGMLRVISTKLAHKVLTKVFWVSRPMPIMVPKMVAKTNPTKATRNSVAQANQVSHDVIL